MPDQTSLQHLEDLDQKVSHLVKLLTEADQALEQSQAVIANYNQAHNNNPAHGTAISSSLTNIQGLISSYTNEHNQLVGMIKEAKDEANKRTDDDLGF